MDQAGKYFDAYVKGGLPYVESQVDKGVEDLNLEFKVVTSDNGQPSETDLRGFAKTASAFANAMGGLLVWGVHAKAGEDKRDVIRAVPGVKKCADFRNALMGLEGQLLGPPIEGISHEIISDGTKELLLTLIPRGKLLHMARGKEMRYYLRTGSGTHKMEAFEIQARYGALPQPELYVIARVAGAGGLNSGHDVHGFFRLVISVGNRGYGTARNVSLRVKQTGGRVLQHDDVNSSSGFLCLACHKS